MDNNMQLTYKGKVSLKIKIGNEIYSVEEHNNGTPDLMKAFAKFLSNNSVPYIDTPQFLDLRRRENAESDFYGILMQTIPLSGKEYYFDGEYNNWVCKYTTAISYSMLEEAIDVSDTREYRLYLYSGTNDNQLEPVDLAYLAVDVQSLSRITPGTQAIIEWLVQVSN